MKFRWAKQNQYFEFDAEDRLNFYDAALDAVIDARVGTGNSYHEGGSGEDRTFYPSLQLHFECPNCGDWHYIRVTAENGRRGYVGLPSRGYPDKHKMRAADNTVIQECGSDWWKAAIQEWEHCENINDMVDTVVGQVKGNMNENQDWEEHNDETTL